MDSDQTPPNVDYLDLARASPFLLDELHHLFWIAPRRNKGKFDGGWSCREHALALGALALLSGRSAYACHGRAAFVCGPGAGNAPIGWEVEPHTWVHIDGLGGCDLSVRLGVGVTAGRWPECEKAHLFAGKFRPEGTSIYLSTDSPQKFAQAYAAATNLDGQSSALYCRERLEPITWATIRDARRWINSPLTDQLRNRFPGKSDLYERALWHCAALLRGEAETLRSAHHNAAWRTLASEQKATVTEY